MPLREVSLIRPTITATLTLGFMKSWGRALLFGIEARVRAGKAAGRALGRILPTLFMLSFFAASIVPGRADPIRFAALVQFKLVSALGALAGDVPSLKTTVNNTGIQMTLSNMAAAGADKGQELVAVVDKSNLSLISSVVYDLSKGAPIRRMQRKVGTSILDNNKAEIFEYMEIKDGKPTTTEPYVEFKVVDFLSVMLVAADAVERNETQPINLSMLRDRSVVRVTLKVMGPETVGGRPGTMVRVAPPDNPNGGIGYVIGRTNDGTYYPARISVETSRGLVQLDGLPQ